MFDYSNPSFHPVSQLRKFTIILYAYLAVGSAFQWLVRRWTTNLTVHEWQKLSKMWKSSVHHFQRFSIFNFNNKYINIPHSIHSSFLSMFRDKMYEDTDTVSLYIIYIKLFYTKLNMKRKFALSFRGFLKSKHISFETDRKSWIRSDHRTGSSRTINFSIEDRIARRAKLPLKPYQSTRAANATILLPSNLCEILCKKIYKV